MRKMLAVLTVVFLLAVAVSSGNCAGPTTETREAGIAGIVSIGTEKNHWDAMFVIDSIAPGGDPFWRTGNDLFLGRLKRAEGISLRGRITVIAAEKAGKHEIAWRTTGGWAKIKFDENQHFVDFDIPCSAFGKPGEVTPFELGWKDKSGKHDFIRAVFKLSWRSGSVTENRGFFVDNIENPVPEQERTAENMAGLYQEYQRMDPTFGGGVTDPILLPLPEEQTNDADQKAQADGLQNFANDVKTAIGDLTKRTDVLVGAVNDSAKTSAENAARIARLEEAWQRAQAQKPATPSVGVGPVVQATATAPKMVHFRIAFVRASGQSMRATTSIADLPLVAVQMEYRDGGELKTGCLPGGVAEYLNTGVASGTNMVFRACQLNGRWSDPITLTITEAMEGQVMVVPVSQ